MTRNLTRLQLHQSPRSESYQPPNAKKPRRYAETPPLVATVYTLRYIIPTMTADRCAGLDGRLAGPATAVDPTLDASPSPMDDSNATERQAHDSLLKQLLLDPDPQRAAGKRGILVASRQLARPRSPEAQTEMRLDRFGRMKVAPLPSKESGSCCGRNYTRQKPGPWSNAALILAAIFGSITTSYCYHAIRGDLGASWRLLHLVSATMCSDSDRCPKLTGDHRFQLPMRFGSAISSVLVEPATLLLGIAVASLSLTAYYHLHRGETHQDMLVVTLVGGSALLSNAMGFEPVAVLMDIVPWCSIAALLLSTYCTQKNGGEYCHSHGT